MSYTPRSHTPARQAMQAGGLTAIRIRLGASDQQALRTAQTLMAGTLGRKPSVSLVIATLLRGSLIKDAHAIR